MGESEEGLLPGRRGVRWKLGVGLGVLGIFLLFAASTALTIAPGALPTTIYISALALALVLITIAYLLVR